MDESQNQVEAPLSLLPDLTAWGIEEVDKGVCEDTAENRRVIRDMKSRYLPVFDSVGKQTNLIQVITPEMRQAALGASKAILLTDDRNVDSDYIVGARLISEPASDHIVPAWVTAATRHWLDVADKRKTVPNYRPALAGPPKRCEAHRIDGHRCANWTNGMVDYGNFCRMHQSNRPHGEEEFAGHLQRARNRIQSAAEGATDVLEELMYNATSEVVRKSAASDLLDRAGIRGGVEIDSKITVLLPAADIVRERLERLREGALAKQAIEASAETEEAEIEYAEVVVEDD